MVDDDPVWGARKLRRQWADLLEAYWRGEWPKPRRIITCVGCGQRRPHHARLLCTRCYDARERYQRRLA